MHPQCRLLVLPPELRNQIYRAILVSDELTCLSERSQTNASEAAIGASIDYRAVQEPAFLATCRQFRHEALAIYYGENIFFSALRDPIAIWLKALGPERADLIRCIRGFSPNGYLDYSWAKSLLQSLEAWLDCAGCRIQPGILQVPFVVRNEELKGRVLWLGSAGGSILSSREGVLERGRDMFWIQESVDNGVVLRRRGYASSIRV